MEAVAGSMATKNSNLLAGCSRTDPERRMAPNSDAAAYVSLSCRMSTLKMEAGSLQRTPGGRWLSENQVQKAHGYSSVEI